MLSRRYVFISGIVLITFGILFEFQNCAPADPRGPAVDGESGGADVRLIDEFNKAEIQFAATEVQVYDTASEVSVTGLCTRAHNGATLSWSLWSPGGDVMLKGESRCSSGGFSVHIRALEQMACGVTNQLIIQGDWGGSAFTGFVRRCQPLARQDQALEGAPLGTTCALEYSLSSDSVAPCLQACYRTGLLVSEFPVETSRCSALAASLAGP